MSYQDYRIENLIEKLQGIQDDEIQNRIKEIVAGKWGSLYLLAEYLLTTKQYSACENYIYTGVALLIQAYETYNGESIYRFVDVEIWLAEIFLPKSSFNIYERPTDKLVKPDIAFGWKLLNDAIQSECALVPYFLALATYYFDGFIVPRSYKKARDLTRLAYKHVQSEWDPNEIRYFRSDMKKRTKVLKMYKKQGKHNNTRKSNEFNKLVLN